jgi:hypothetical protein
MILLLGDSNLRQTFEAHKAEIEAAAEEEVEFDQATTNEALKVSLAKSRKEAPCLVFVSTILNEIAASTGKGTSRDAVVKAVATEQLELVNRVASGSKSGSTLFVIIQPHIRTEPKWMEEKSALARFYLMEIFTKVQHSANMIVMPEPEISIDDLSQDKVHLKPEGQRKFANTLMDYIKNCKIELRRKRGEDLDWEDMELDSLSQKTPKTNKKRQRHVSIESEEEGTSKKIKDDESVMSVLKAFMQEFRDEAKKNNKKGKEVKKDIDSLKESEVEIKQRLTKIEQSSSNDSIYTATIKEDLDVVENEALKNVVIIKKLKATKKLPNERNDLSLQIQHISKDLVHEILGDQNKIAYTSLLYTGKEAVRIVDGFTPPFKIVFKTKQAGVDFKEKAVQLSKNPNHKLSRAYLTNQQTPATRIRTSLMWAISEKLKDQAKGIDAWVTQNMTKPLLQVKGEERFQRGYSFVNAMVKYGSRIDDKAKEDALKLAKRFYPGQVEKIFIIIKE